MYISAIDDRAFAAEAPAIVAEPLRQASAPGAEPVAEFRYLHASPRPNWAALTAIALAHILLLVALVKFDVISIAAKPKPLQMTIVPIDIVPPPVTQSQPPKTKTAETPIVAPPPIVAIPVTAPPPLVTAPTPPVVQIAPPAPPSPAPPAPGIAQGPVEIGKLSMMAGNPPLKYPVSARMRREQGVVRLRILVGTDGRVREIALAQSSGFDSLDKAAMEVVRGWRFVAPTRDGVPVEGIGIFPATFKLA